MSNVRSIRGRTQYRLGGFEHAVRAKDSPARALKPSSEGLVSWRFCWRFEVHFFSFDGVVARTARESRVDLLE